MNRTFLVPTLPSPPRRRRRRQVTAAPRFFLGRDHQHDILIGGVLTSDGKRRSACLVLSTTV